jgi:hypothetical protein
MQYKRCLKELFLLKCRTKIWLSLCRFSLSSQRSVGFLWTFPTFCFIQIGRKIEEVRLNGTILRKSRTRDDTMFKSVGKNFTQICQNWKTRAGMRLRAKLIFTKPKFTWRNFVTNIYAEIHGKLTIDLVADSRSQIHRESRTRTDGLSGQAS